MVQFNKCTPIPVDCDTSINHVAFDGCDYFCTIRCQCEIMQFNACRSVQHKYCTCREYDCICYDYHEHCFWASSRTCCSKLFKLDCSMNEIDCISLCGTSQYGASTGISYNCCKRTLIVSFACVVAEVDKCSGNTNVLYTTKEYWIIGVLSIYPCMLLTVFRCSQCYIIVLNECGEKIGSFCVDNPSFPANLLFNPCKSDCHQSPIWAVVLKQNCYPYLCNTDIFCDDPGEKPHCCNYEICEECCCDKEPCPDQDPCKDIMKSIALMEAALSHILNAEGEKIQKVLATTDDIDKILCVNKEVNKTIVNATHLEHTLYAKLSALSECRLCNDLCAGDCDGDCHCPCGDEENKEKPFG